MKNKAIRVFLICIHNAFLFFASYVCWAETSTPLLVIDTIKTQHLSSLGVCEVVGQATNVSGKSISEAFIKVNLYDKDKALVGNTILHIRNIEPKTKWKFKDMAAVSCSSAKVVEVAAYP